MCTSWSTETHYQRASNHNSVNIVFSESELKHTIKEHQITTFQLSKMIRGGTETHYQRASNHNAHLGEQSVLKLKHTIKEHQITTVYNLVSQGAGLKHTIKEHQITTFAHFLLYPFVLKHTIKEHQITTPGAVSSHSRRTETHYQRASNHNDDGERLFLFGTETHYQRASNHNLRCRSFA